MKTCNNCHTVLPDDAAACPVCGAKADMTPEKADGAPTKKSSTPLIVGILAAVALVAVIVAVVLISGKKKAPAPEKEPETAAETDPGSSEKTEAPDESGHHINAYGYVSNSIHFEQDEAGNTTYSYMDENGQLQTVDPAEAEALMDRVVATCGDMSLDNRSLMYYYDQQYYSFYSVYGSYMAYLMDSTRALDEQQNMEGTGTWQHFFLNSAFDLFRQVAALYQDATAAGFTLSAEEQAALDSMTADMEAFAASNNYESAQAYLSQVYGPTATMESYQTFYRVLQTAMSYAQSLADAVAFTDQDISDYFDANADTIYQNYHVEKVDKPVVNVRHILIQPEDTESEESWTEAEAEAQRIYDEWRNGDATEDSFAALANEHSVDPGSNTNGGLYEGVYPGQMVETFNDWCFDDGRKTGDSGIVKTDYGYHIMYYVSEGDTVYWRTLAEDLYRNEQAAILRDAVVAKYESTSEPSQAVLMDAMAPSVPAADDAAESETGETAEPETESATK